jgi:UDP-N-acetylmuramate--alanine ligase
VSKLDQIQRIYFIGIGGIGMSALARYFKSKGVEVSGYDRSATSLTKELEAAGIAIHYEERVDLLPKQVDAVVYTTSRAGVLQGTWLYSSEKKRCAAVDHRKFF